MRHAKQTTMKIIKIITPLLLLTISCLGQKAISTIESNNYDKKTDLTTFTKFPFGSISIPGKWKKISYNQVSRQHNFTNVDSIFTAIAINQASSYPFYKPNMTPNQTVEELYEWDSKYLADNIKGTRTIIKQDTVNHFILWQIEADNQKYKLDNHYLFGSENGVVFSVFIDTKKWTNDKKVEFLQTVYKTKTVGSCCK